MPRSSQKVDDLENLVLDGGIVVIQVGLVRIKAMPEVALRDRVPRPIRLFGVLENNAHALIFLIRVAPDVIVAVRRIGVFPRRLKPGMLIGGVIQDEVGDDAHAAFVGGRGQGLEILDSANRRMDSVEVRDVVAVVFERRRIDGHQPDAIDPEVADVVELFGQPAQIAVAIRIAVEESTDIDLVEDRVLIPVGWLSVIADHPLRT